MTYISKIFVTVDTVLFKKERERAFLLLIKRKNNPFKGFWALPGGFVDENEDILEAAKRELFEETTIKCDSLIQVGAFGKPFRDPRSHVITIAYYGWVEADIVGKAADDAKELAWFDINDLPNLAFDHEVIINEAIKKAF